MAAVVIGSRNKHKVQEIRQLLAGLPIDVLSLQDFPDAPEVEEDGDTFEANALKKARIIADFTGLTTLADDSGLEVDTLGGQPGVHSARFAGASATDEENNIKLLRLLDRCPAADRTARFRCAIALVGRGDAEELVKGICSGVIISQPQGTGGFGYDPLFMVPDLGKTFAELSSDEKNRISHRGKALRKVLAVIREWSDRGWI
ncbi:MAG: XTP/dITP diphosphatase [Firmicutes bacterium]|nr:XTP/dITP diphosphatase [Bacillota bacterium]